MTISLAETLIYIDTFIIDALQSGNDSIKEECSFDESLEHQIVEIYNTYKKGCIVDSEIPFAKCEIVSCKISTSKEYISAEENVISDTKVIIEIHFKKLDKQAS